MAICLLIEAELPCSDIDSPSSSEICVTFTSGDGVVVLEEWINFIGDTDIVVDRWHEAGSVCSASFFVCGCRVATIFGGEHFQCSRT